MRAVRLNRVEVFPLPALFIAVLALAATACTGESGAGGTSGAEAGPTTSAQAPSAEADESGPSVGPSLRTAFTDSLVLVANLEEAPLHLLPGDWGDLFHFRFADEVLTLEPESSPEVSRFMARVIEAEARRAGTADAGYDWLRRLDTSVLAYEAEADDVRWRLRQGHAWFALLPSSEVGPLLEREGFRLVPLASGADPDGWYRGDGGGAGVASATAGADGGEGDSGPVLPGDWLAVWAAEVRGRG